MTMNDGRQGTLFRAPFVVPVSGPIIQDGAVFVLGGHIAAVGRYADLRGQGGRLVDLEQRIITPALINCHTHLELSYLADLGRDNGFANQDITVWIKVLLGRRRAAQENEEIEAAAAAAWRGLHNSGVALALDIGNTLTCSAMTGGQGPDIDFLLEFLGLDSEVLAELQSRLNKLHGTSCTAHAPHTTHPKMIRRLKKRSLSAGGKFSIHTAESEAEIEFLQQGTGPFRDFYIERLVEPPGCGAVEYMDSLGVLDADTICVHTVHISDAEAELLAHRHVGVCLCPGSNRFLGVGRVKLAMLLDKGIRPCLGTDSLASNRELNLWREMRILQEDHPSVAPMDIFAMATVNGARAMARGELGSLDSGRVAQILAVEFADLSANEVYAYLVNVGAPNLIWLEDR